MQDKKTFKYNFIWLLLICLLIFHKPMLKIFFVVDYERIIIPAAEQHGLNPHLLSALIFVESRFDTRAESAKGARGLMQIMPQTGEWAAQQLGFKGIDADDLHDPEVNIFIGTWYLDYLKEKLDNNEILALAAYNAGYGNVQKWRDESIWDGDVNKTEKIPFPETKKYILQIVTLRKIYEYLYPDLKMTIQERVAEELS